MPIYRLLERESFDPEVVALLCEVFEDVLATLGLVDRLDPVTELARISHSQFCRPRIWGWKAFWEA
jgi:hypothetical protein